MESFSDKNSEFVFRRRGSYGLLRPNMSEESALNLVLCGRTGAEKISVVQSILGRAELPAVSSPEQCVKHQGEVCGRWVSLVELPALSGKPLETVMEQSLSCISLCAPEGVHAFILVLPVAPLTDEHKTEIKIIQDTFSSKVNVFTMIVFTVDSESTAPAVDDFVKGDRDLQELSQSCGGGHLIFNTRRTQQQQQQLSELLDSIETLKNKNNPHSYTTQTLHEAHIEKILRLHREIVQLTGSSARRRGVDLSSDCLRIALIGKTGCGKSSSGNTILGRKSFRAVSRQTSVTRVCQKEESTVDGRHVAVVDTPGLFDTSLSHDEVNKEMIKCISHLAPGPHVFLLVLQIGRFTDEEKETLDLIKRGFGKGAEKFTIILFTHGDQLVHDDITIEDYIETCDTSFKKLISDCGNRIHVFNNYEKNRSQVKELLEKINDVVKENGGNYYTNDMLQEAEAAIQEEMERLLKEKEEQMKRVREEMEKKHQEEMNKQKEEFDKERKQRENDLREKEEKIKKEKEQRKKEEETREEENRKMKEQEEKQLQEWKGKRTDLEEKIKSEQASKEKFETQLQQNRREMEQEKEKWERERNEWLKKRRAEEEDRRQKERKMQKELRQIENEKEQKEKELINKEAKIKKEQEQRKKDQEKRKEEDKKRTEQEEKQRQEWERKHSELEEKIKSEEQSKETFELKLQESIRQMEQEREKWEKEKKEWWKKRQQEDEEKCKEVQQKIQKLQDEYNEERQRDQMKRLKEREEEEKKMKELKDEYQAKIEEMNKEVRRKAEELNDFRKKHEKIFQEMKQQHKESIKDKDEKYDLLKALAEHQRREKMEVHRKEVMKLVQVVSKNKGNVKKIHELLIKHENEMKSVKTEKEFSYSEEEYENSSSEYESTSSEKEVS